MTHELIKRYYCLLINQTVILIYIPKHQSVNKYNALNLLKEERKKKLERIQRDGRTNIRDNYEKKLGKTEKY